MKHHLVTVAILLVAVSFYILGNESLGGIAFIVGGVFELWFWLRVFRND